MLQVSDLPAPVGAASQPVGVPALPLSPAQQLFFYDPDRWEEFVREWAKELDSSYFQVKRIGGSNDKGADVAGFLSQEGFEGEWDCFQCKHYAKPLAWGDLLPEILKVFRHAAAGEYKMPRRYRFVAPQGLSNAMNRLVSKPSDLKAKFLKDAPAKIADLALPSALVTEIMRLAGEDSFSRFGSEELGDVIDVHRRSPYFNERFGAPLPPRTQHGSTPDQVTKEETRYIAHLLDVYAEKFGPDFDGAVASSDERTERHFKNQRVRFFEAESLRAYARDSVPPGTFARFQDAILSGIEDTLDSDHANGWARLTSALSVAGQLNLSSHALIAVAGQDDLKGVCHQLANDDRVRWI